MLLSCWRYRTEGLGVVYDGTTNGSGQDISPTNRYWQQLRHRMYIRDHEHLCSSLWFCPGLHRVQYISKVIIFAIDYSVAISMKPVLSHTLTSVLY